MNTSYSSLVTLLGVLAERDDVVVWIRTPNYRQQLYVSPAFSAIWGRDSSKLFSDPLSWTEYLVNDERTAKIAELCARNPLSIDNTRNTTYYRVDNPKKGIQYIRDTCFFICNSDNKVIAIAGVAAKIEGGVWEHELNKIENLDSSQELEISQALITQQGDDLPSNKKDSLPNYYVFLRNGDHVGLSSREITCLKYSLQGLTAKMIAKNLGIEHRTIEDYLSNLKRKLGCKNKGEIYKTIHPATLDLLESRFEELR